MASCAAVVNRRFPGRLFSARQPFSSVTSFHERRLPHLHEVGRPMFITWRLHGSLPKNRHFPTNLTSGEAFVAMDRLLDRARTGPLFLRQPEMASMVVDAIRWRDGRQYELHAFVVMANHVHLLVTPRLPVTELTHSLKRYTAREGNRALGASGKPFWQDESYDRLVRDRAEFERIARYIEMNPVRACIVSSPEQFPWSNASGG